MRYRDVIVVGKCAETVGVCAPLPPYCVVRELPGYQQIKQDLHFYHHFLLKVTKHLNSFGTSP